MHETPFAVWSNFYVITGSSAAALTGLMFVVITLVAGRRLQPLEVASVGISTFSTPTVIHFCAAFLVSGLMSAPWTSLRGAAVIVGLAGIFGVLYVVRVIYLAARRLRAYQPDFEDLTWFAILPLLAYFTILATAVLLPLAAAQALFGLAGATMLLIFIGIHNAWDVVTFLVAEQLKADDMEPRNAQDAQ